MDPSFSKKFQKKVKKVKKKFGSYEQSPYLVKEFETQTP